MATEERLDIIKELAALDLNGINTMTVAASAYRAGIAYGYEQAKNAGAEQIRSKEADEA